MLPESATKRAKSALAWAKEALMGLVVAALPLLDVAEVGSGAQVAKAKQHH